MVDPKTLGLGEQVYYTVPELGGYLSVKVREVHIHPRYKHPILMLTANLPGMDRALHTSYLVRHQEEAVSEIEAYYVYEVTPDDLIEVSPATAEPVEIDVERAAFITPIGIGIYIRGMTMEGGDETPVIMNVTETRVLADHLENLADEYEDIKDLNETINELDPGTPSKFQA